MKIYESAIIGSGYTSIGYALAKGNSIIIEQNETADVGFYLCLKNYNHGTYAPTTQAGKSLLSLYQNLNLINEKEQNLSGFECGFCEFIFQNGLEILFKTRVVETQKEDGIYKLTLITSGGIDYVYAKDVLDLTNVTPDKESLTILYHTDTPNQTESDLKTAFKGCVVENAFFENRLAVRIPVEVNKDFNAAKIEIFDKWKESKINAKILYFAPIFAKIYTTPNNAMQDGYYSNPFEAFEYGYNLANSQKEGK